MTGVSTTMTEHVGQPHLVVGGHELSWAAEWNSVNTDLHEWSCVNRRT